MKKRFCAVLGGAAAGVINGMLGAAGGLIVVPVLRHAGCDTRRAHATSVAVILPICVGSALAYRNGGWLDWADALPYLPGGLLGAWAGAALLPHIPSDALRRVFGLFMLWAAVRIWMR